MLSLSRKELRKLSIKEGDAEAEEAAATAIQSIARLRQAQDRHNAKVRLQKTTQKVDALEALFSAVDRNNDGSITRVELTRALHAQSPESAALQKSLCRMLGLPKAVSGPYAREVFNQVFSCIDADNTAEITIDEMRTFVADLDHLRDMHNDATAEEGEAVSAGAPLLNDEVRGLLQNIDVSPHGELNHMDMLQVLNWTSVREVIEERRRRGIVRIEVLHVEVFDLATAKRTAKKIAQKQHERTAARHAAEVAALEAAELTEEEELDLALAAAPELTAEQLEQRASDAFWEARADALMRAADTHNRNQLLSRTEIAAFMVGNVTADADDRWFISWLLEGDRGGNFGRYDADNSGEIDLGELRAAIKDWARFAKAETLRREETRGAMLARKRQLRAARAASLENADERAAEIMSVCTVAALGRASISVLAIKKYLVGNPRYQPFALWMLKDRCRVFKRHDVDKSGTIELDELEKALEEYFDEVRDGESSAGP